MMGGRERRMTTTTEKQDPRTRGLSVRLVPGADEPALRSLIGKSIAVSSGKGGVGKTITACNLAIYYARRGLRVGLVDADPLSDVATLLDLQESEDALKGARDGPKGARDASLEANLLPVFKGLEIVFPFQKLDRSEVSGLMDRIYRLHLKEIEGRYDLVLFDMPAGMDHEENLAYLPFMKRLVLVTTPEPTSHASAGAYVREVQRLYPGTPIKVWHNRYSSRMKDGFHPSDVAGNYNRFVDPQDRLSAEQCATLEDFAFVPEDPAMDLLKGEPDPAIHVLMCMKDSLDYAHGRLLSQAARRLGFSRGVHEIIASYVQRHPRLENPIKYLDGLADHLNTIIQVVADPHALKAVRSPLPVWSFTPQERDTILAFLQRVRKSALRKQILDLQELLQERMHAMEGARGPFAAGVPVGSDPALDRELARFLMTLGKSAKDNALVRNQGVLLLFYFCLHKLLQSKTLLRLLKGLIPRKPNRGGRMVRDRLQQIRNLVERDPQYRQRYLKATRTIHTVVMKQLATVAQELGLQVLLLRDEHSRLDARAYLKLLASFLHETVYSGLSVIVGFDYRAATVAFQAGAEKLLASLELAPASGRAAPS